MHIYESAQDYLERILMLTKDNKNVRSIDIAKDMGVTKQSVHRAIKNLKENEYIEVNEKGYISLSEKGKVIAEKFYNRHLILSEFFKSIGVSEDTALKDACKV